MAINKITRDDIAEFSRLPTANAYQAIALKSAIYPGQGSSFGLLYVALKGSGEAGEFAEHVGKAMRDDDMLIMSLPKDPRRGDSIMVTDAGLRADRHSKLVKELGDELWYCAAKARELGLTLEEVMTVNLEKLCDRTERNALRGSGDDR